MLYGVKAVELNAYTQIFMAHNKFRPGRRVRPSRSLISWYSRQDILRFNDGWGLGLILLLVHVEDGHPRHSLHAYT